MKDKDKKLVITGTGADDTVMEADEFSRDLLLKLAKESDNDLVFVARLATLCAEAIVLVQAFEDDARDTFDSIVELVIEARTDADADVMILTTPPKSDLN